MLTRNEMEGMFREISQRRRLEIIAKILGLEIDAYDDDVALLRNILWHLEDPLGFHVDSEPADKASDSGNQKVGQEVGDLVARLQEEIKKHCEAADQAANDVVIRIFNEVKEENGELPIEWYVKKYGRNTDPDIIRVFMNLIDNKKCLISQEALKRKIDTAIKIFRLITEE